MRKSRTDEIDDLFAASGTRSDVASGSGLVAPGLVRLIDSPLVAETADWMDGKAKELGSLLAAERAVEYVAVLRAFADFRRNHEPEPLHEDIARAVCGDTPDPFAELTLTQERHMASLRIPTRALSRSSRRLS